MTRDGLIAAQALPPRGDGRAMGRHARKGLTRDHPLQPECWPSAGNCRKRWCYRCGRSDGNKHRGATSDDGLLVDDVHRWWWNHNWITHWQPNNRGGCWVRSFPGGSGHVLAFYTVEPTDRTGRTARRSA